MYKVIQVFHNIIPHRFHIDQSKTSDRSQAPVTMIVNSRELCSADFDLREVIPLQLEDLTHGGARGAALKQIQDIGTKRHVLSVDNDNEFRSRCE